MQGHWGNFSFAQAGYVASTGFTVNATAYINSAGYINESALLYVSTSDSSPFTAGSISRRTGLEDAEMSYTDEGVPYSDPVTCMVSALPLLPAVPGLGVRLPHHQDPR